MKDLIEKDLEVSRIKKEINALHKKTRALNLKLGAKVEKIISSKFPIAISFHKWRVSEKEIYIPPEDSLQRNSSFGRKKSFSLGFEMVPDDLEFISHQSPSMASSINLNKYLSSGLVRPRAKKSMMIKRRPPAKIKSFNDLVIIAERWEIYRVKWKKVSFAFNSGCFRIESSNSIDDVYSAVRELNIPMDLGSHITQIESLEEELKRRKDLVADLSSQMLFGI